MGVCRQREVTALGRVECAPQHDLPGRRRQLVLAPDDVRDRHGAVVHRVGQDEERLAVPLHRDEVLQRPLRELHLAAHQVDDPHHPFVGRPEAQGAALATGQAEIAAVPVVARRGVAGRRPQACALVDLLPGARAGVEGAGVPQRLDGGRVRLLVRRLEVRALVGSHAEPVEGGDDPVGPLGPVARLVRVLDPQDEDAPLLAHEEPVEQRGPRAADVEVPGRGGGEARPGRGGGDGHGIRRRTTGADGVRGERPGVSLPLWRWRPSGSR